MDGRVKTLHPKIHGGLLARRDADRDAMREHGIAGIDLLVVNLYPFEQAVANPDCDLATAIEHIDVGGPAMLRAAAKNHAWVTVVVDAGDYAAVLGELRVGGAVAPATRFRLAVKAFEHTARYDGAIAGYLGARDGTEAAPAVFPPTLDLRYVKAREMRYGENPHQRAAFYVERAGAGAGVEAAAVKTGAGASSEAAVKAGTGAGAGTGAEASVATTRQLQGKALSFNNVADTDAALECVKSFEGAGLRDRQAREPLRGCDRGRHPRCLRSGVQDRSDVRVRRDHRVQPSARRADRYGHRRAAVRRGRHRAPHRSRGAGAARGQARRARPRMRRAPGRAAPRARFQARHRRAAGAGPRHRHGYGRRPWRW